MRKTYLRWAVCPLASYEDVFKQEFETSQAINCKKRIHPYTSITASCRKKGILIAEKREAKSVFMSALKRVTHYLKKVPFSRAIFRWLPLLDLLDILHRIIYTEVHITRNIEGLMAY